MSVLVTGGAGYIGSHTCIRLLEEGFDVIILDNLSNSKQESVNRIRELSGCDVKFVEGDIRDEAILDKLFSENSIDSVVHFAGLKAVGESVAKPLEYYDNNIGGTLTLCKAMKLYGCKKMVFSSSATVYGMNNVSPLREDMQAGGTTNPYGTTKFMIEKILEDIAASDKSTAFTMLRYFNPIGAHISGRIGENPNGIPNNLMPYISQVAVGKLPCLSIYGDDYDTADGTGVRDYIHVWDLADGHIKALQNLPSDGGYNIYNLGTGKGYSVLDLVHAFENASGVKINYKIVDRRPGDIATCFADASKAKRELGWEARLGIDRMCEDSWRWQSSNPNGF